MTAAPLFIFPRAQPPVARAGGAESPASKPKHGAKNHDQTAHAIRFGSVGGAGVLVRRHPVGDRDAAVSAYRSTRVYDGVRTMSPEAAARHKARLRKLIASGRSRSVGLRIDEFLDAALPGESDSDRQAARLALIRICEVAQAQALQAQRIPQRIHLPEAPVEWER